MTIALITLLSVASSTTAHASGVADEFTAALNKGPLYAALAAALGGLLTSLTPCVYPMIAVTVSVFGARQSKSKREALLLSTVFVLGIAAMFTPMGLIAGLTGNLFGSALSNRWVIVVIAAIFLALAGSMFGLFEFVLPSKLTNKLSTMGGIGYGGAFVLGIVSGVVAAPCTGPVLTGILLWIGKTQNPWLGAAALFAFSLGLGVPFWLVGTFAIRLPKSGRWMMTIKSIFGTILAIVALYFLKNAFPQLSRALPDSSTTALVAAAIAVIGIGIGAIHLSFGESRSDSLRKAIGLCLAVIGIVVCITWLEKPKATTDVASDNTTPHAWLHDESAALAAARASSMPMLIDFTADWCSACKRLARETFREPGVHQELARFVLLELDATHDDDPHVVELQKRYRVVGLPTVILLDSQGTEVARFTDFVPPGEFLKALQPIK